MSDNSLLPLDKSIHYCMIVEDNGKCQVTRRNVSVPWENVFKMLKNICNTEFEVGQAFRELWRYISKTQRNISCSNMLEDKSTPKMITNWYSINIRSYYHKRNIENLWIFFSFFFFLWTKTNVHLFIYASQEWQRNDRLYLVSATHDCHRQAFM